MTKKFLSILLTAALTLSIFPVINVSAADGTTFMSDDFESYELGVLSSGQEVFLSVDGVNRWKKEEGYSAEIISVKDADGNDTKALKYINGAGKGTNINSDIYRLKVQKDPGHTQAITELAGLVFVQELSFWIPKNIVTSEGTDYKRPHKFNVGNCAYVEGNQINLSNKVLSLYAIEDETWYNVTTVLDFTNYKVSGDPVSYLMYVNDKLIYHGTKTSDYIVPAASLGYSMISASVDTSSRTDLNGGFNDVYFIIDNVNFYSSPNSAVASSAMDGDNRVSCQANPQVSFTKPILNVTSGDEASVSVSNVTMKTTSDGEAAQIEKIELSEDGLTLKLYPENDLLYNTDYTVIISGLKDMHGVAVPEYSFSFKTKKMPDFTSGEPVFSKEYIGTKAASGYEITSLEDGHILCSYPLKNNNTSSSKEAIMFAVLRDEGKLVAIEFKKVSLAPGTSTVFNVGFDIDDAQNQSIETYVWDNFVNRDAVCSSYRFSSEGITSTLD